MRRSSAVLAIIVFGLFAVVSPAPAAAQSVSNAQINGILVQKMEKGLAEIILGFKRDPQVGPVVVLGIGGVLAEIYKDIAIRLAPVDLDTARGMVEEVRGLAVIRGYRGLPRGAGWSRDPPPEPLRSQLCEFY